MIDNAVILLTMSIVIIAAGFFVVFSFRISKIDRFKLLLSYFAAVSVLLVIYNLYINFKSNERIEKNRIAYNTIENVKNNYLEPQKLLLASYPEGYFLYASMNQNADLIQHEPKQYDPIKRKQVEVCNALRVFQSIEDFLSVGCFDLTGQYVWINVFLGWMQSPILQYYWSCFEFDYSADTRELIAKIIEKSNSLVKLRKQKGKLTSKDYDDISKKFEVTYR